MLVVLEMYYKWQKGTYRNKEAGSADILSSRKREGENRRKGGETKEGKNVKEKAGRKLNHHRSRWRSVWLGETLQLNQVSLRTLSRATYGRVEKGIGFLEKCISTQWSLWFLPLHICRALTSSPYPRRHSHFLSFTSVWKAEGDEALLGSLINLICGKPYINHWIS